ncbi:MAG: 4-(cytidine 5'-diphospho)-2-C-methyl-D-erythritol kinase [Candidatus Curtissbacteria bacterium]|nr:4-(cytidine 5'-diphospho)-2-C-methyl-D-erythritol kinase [Candidatus Curtissbacteria bacterium]
MIVETALAKFDLAIHINPRKQDGLYPVDYLDCQIDICDKLSFFPKQNDIEIVCDNPNVPTNEDNFIYKAAILLKKIAGDKNLGAKIVLKKQIPVTSGFGGGSSDAVAAVRGLCKLWKIKLNARQIDMMAKNLGKDFFYSLYGGLGEIKSRGKNYVFKKLSKTLPKFYLVVVVPNKRKPSTGWIYEHLVVKKVGKNIDKLKLFKKAIVEGDREQFLANLHNDLEESIWQFSSQIDRMKRDLEALGARRSIMAGAGLSVVGFFDTKAKADRVREKLAEKYKQIYVARLLN